MSWDYQPHQLTIADEGYPILKQYGALYLAMEERTGKTGVAICICELSKATDILVITKKKAISGWQEHLDNLPISNTYTVTNYEAVHKLPTKHYKIVILDEASANLSAFPKLGKRAQLVRNLVYNSRLIFMSATPNAQSYSQLFNQFHMTKYSPFNQYPDFYAWHGGCSFWKHPTTGNIAKHKLEFQSTSKQLINTLPRYGVPDYIRIGAREVESYKQTIDFFPQIKHLFISYTRKQLGFKHEPEDELHYVKLKPETSTLMNILAADKLCKPTHDTVYVADAPIKLSIGLYQIEGSTIKLDDQSIQLLGLEKVNYIKQVWGDSPTLAIFYHFKEERNLLEQHFTQAKLYQATAYSMGVDLSHMSDMVIYSMNFSTSDFTQRRCRMANMFRADPITVHYLLVHNSISEHVYNTVALNKRNYVDKYYSGAQQLNL